MRNKWFPLIVVAVLAIFTALVYAQLPDQLPVHWNNAGEIDRYAPTWQGVLIIPGIILLLMGLRYGSRRVDPRRAAYEQFEGTYYLVINVVALLLGGVHILTLGVALGWEISMVRVLLVSVGLALAIMGNEMGRIQPNWFVGIRTPWTLSDPEVWRKTHRAGGYLFFTAGLLAALVSLVLPLEILSFVFIGIILLAAGGTIFYSYRTYQGLHPAN